MPDQPPNYEDPKVQAAWLAEQREVVAAYLQKEKVRHGAIASEAAWSLAPHISIWEVESASDPGKIGWWVIGGDLPTDYIPGHSVSDAREAAAAFSTRWLEVSEYMLRGQRHPEFNVGPAETRYELGDLLRQRAEFLKDWVTDDDMW